MKTRDYLRSDLVSIFRIILAAGGSEMQALRVTQNVTQDGYIHIAIPPEFGHRCEIIVLPLGDSKEGTQSTFNTAKMQEQSGFVQTVLGADSEDVWNDL